MSWDQPGHKSKEELLASEQSQRDELVACHSKTLDGLELQIKEAINKLSSLNKDIESVHVNRLSEYEGRELKINIMKADLDLQQKSIDQQKADLVARSKIINDNQQRVDKSLNDKNTSLLAKSDQLNAMEKELAEYAQKQLEVADQQARTEESLKTRVVELDQANTDLNKAIEKALTDHHEIKSAVEAHQVNLKDLKNRTLDIEARESKNMAFYEAIVAREKDIEPLKQKLEDGIKANETEDKRLRDENIRIYQLHQDADKRIETAIQAEQRAKSEIDRLESLKNDIHARIKQEA